MHPSSLPFHSPLQKGSNYCSDEPDKQWIENTFTKDISVTPRQRFILGNCIERVDGASDEDRSYHQAETHTLDH
jgi:hypothetical protein